MATTEKKGDLSRKSQNIDPGFWRSQTGPAQFVIIALAAIAFIVIAWLFIFSGDEEPARVPVVLEQGQAIAFKQLHQHGFHHIGTHDAWGRDRGGNEHDWKVCSQTPLGLTVPTDTDIELGVVKTTEACPDRSVGDQGIVHAMAVGSRMPDLSAIPGRTAHMVREDFGDDASIRFLEQGRDDHEVKRDLGDWRVCRQNLKAGRVWGGRPLVLAVAKYDANCTAS